MAGLPANCYTLLYFFYHFVSLEISCSSRVHAWFGECLSVCKMMLCHCVKSMLCHCVEVVFCRCGLMMHVVNVNVYHCASCGATFSVFSLSCYFYMFCSMTNNFMVHHALIIKCLYTCPELRQSKMELRQ